MRYPHTYTASKSFTRKSTKRDTLVGRVECEKFERKKSHNRFFPRTINKSISSRRICYIYMYVCSKVTNLRESFRAMRSEEWTLMGRAAGVPLDCTPLSPAPTSRCETQIFTVQSPWGVAALRQRSHTRYPTEKRNCNNDSRYILYTWYAGVNKGESWREWWWHLVWCKI